MNFRLGEGDGDLDRYLFGGNVGWEIPRPPALSDADWRFISVAITAFSGSTPPSRLHRSDPPPVHRTRPSLFLKAKLDEETCCYDQESRKKLSSPLSEKLVATEGRRQDAELEDLLDGAGSAAAFRRDPAVPLNRPRVMRNHVVHADRSVGETGGIERWGGIYLWYFEALLEELDLVRVGSGKDPDSPDH